jgi:hypothetical protein
MNPRERTLAAVLIGMIVLAAGGAAAYLLVLVPLGEKTRAADKLDADLDKVRAELTAARKDAPRLAVARKRSLPADPALAKREYAEMLARVLQKANVAPGYRVTEKTPDTAGVPNLPGVNKKPAYQKVAFEINFDRADMWNVKDVLEGYYRLNVLHQITHFEVKVDTTPGQAGGRAKAVSDRRDLVVKIGTEAIILDGAEPRRTLLPVPMAFAGAGGWLGYNGVALNPEAGRGLTPLQLAPVLSLKNRDYSLVVLKDPFHGPLPPPPPLSLGKIADVAVKAGQKLDPVRVPVAGDVDYLGKVSLSATVEGGPFKGTEVKIDDVRKTIKLEPREGETGTGTVTVVAKAANGQKAERTFKVKVEEAVAEAAPKETKEDIAGSIVLIGVSVRSDGTASAIVRDNYNPLTYELEATSRRVKVLQYEHLGELERREPAAGLGVQRDRVVPEPPADPGERGRHRQQGAARLGPVEDDGLGAELHLQVAAVGHGLGPPAGLAGGGVHLHVQVGDLVEEVEPVVPLEHVLDGPHVGPVERDLERDLLVRRLLPRQLRDAGGVGRLLGDAVAGGDVRPLEDAGEHLRVLALGQGRVGGEAPLAGLQQPRGLLAGGVHLGPGLVELGVELVRGRRLVGQRLEDEQVPAGPADGEDDQPDQDGGQGALAGVHLGYREFGCAGAGRRGGYSSSSGVATTGAPRRAGGRNVADRV